MIKNLYLILILWLLGTVENLSSQNSLEEKTDDHLLVDQWQDYVLANVIVANHLNILMVLASKPDFALTNASNHCTSYITNSNSFRQTISQLADNIRRALIDIYQDLNRIQLSLERIPIHLKTILLLIKKGSKDSINTNLPNLLKKGENIINESLIVLKNPPSKIQQIKDLINELDSLISDDILSFQIKDTQIQWLLLTDLFTQLSIQGDKTANNFLLQFNWIFEQFIRLGIDNYRELIINLLQSKVIEIDRTIDLLTIICQTYISISLEYTNEKLIGNTHLIFISNEQERKEIIRQYQYELKSQAIKIARIALNRHDEFLQRSQNREFIYQTFLNETSQEDLNILLTIN